LPALRFAPVRYTHDVRVLAQLDDFVAINSVLAVDLSNIAAVGRRLIQEKKRSFLDIAGRQLDELDNNVVRITEIDRQTTGSRSGGAAGDAALLARARLEHPPRQHFDVAYDEGDVRRPRPVGRAGHISPDRCQVLDELEMDALAVEMGDPAARPWYPDDGAEPGALAGRQVSDGKSHDIAPERDRPLDVGDREARVIEALDQGVTSLNSRHRCDRV
jgi:hypothetical protein